MKKIVGIIAAAAMATSIFAMDVSGGIKLNGSLFSWDKATKTVTALDVTHGQDAWYAANPFVISVNGDRAGGQIKIWDGTTSQMISDQYAIWFKPFDGLKVELGTCDDALNVDHITWSAIKMFDTCGWGYKATYNVDALTFTLGFGSGFFSKVADTTTVGEMYFTAAYAADFGNIKFAFDAKNKFNNLKFGAGFNGNAGSLGYFFDVVFEKAATNGLRFGFDFNSSVDAISWEVAAAVKSSDISNFGNTMAIPVVAKFGYALNGGTAYIKFNDPNVKANSFKADIEAGYDGSLGAIGYEIEAKFAIDGNNITISVPFWVNLNF